MFEFLSNKLILGFCALEASLNLVRGILSLIVVRAASQQILQLYQVPRGKTLCDLPVAFCTYHHPHILTLVVIA